MRPPRDDTPRSGGGLRAELSCIILYYITVVRQLQAFAGGGWGLWFASLDSQDVLMYAVALDVLEVVLINTIAGSTVEDMQDVCSHEQSISVNFYREKGRMRKLHPQSECDLARWLVMTVRVCAHLAHLASPL